LSRWSKLCCPDNRLPPQLRLPPIAFDEESLDAWYAELQSYAERIRAALAAGVPGGDFSAYDRPDMQWAQSSFIQPQVMVSEFAVWRRSVKSWEGNRLATRSRPQIDPLLHAFCSP